MRRLCRFLLRNRFRFRSKTLSFFQVLCFWGFSTQMALHICFNPYIFFLLIINFLIFGIFLFGGVNKSRYNLFQISLPFESFVFWFIVYFYFLILYLIFAAKKPKHFKIVMCMNVCIYFGFFPPKCLMVHISTNILP